MKLLSVAAVQLVGLVGLALLVRGLFLVYPPSAFIGAGVLCLAYAVLKS